MRKTITLSLALAALVVCQGCASITHVRPVALANGAIAYERETAWGFFQQAAVANVSSTTKDGSYSHAFRAKDGAIRGDPDTITASGAALGRFGGEIANTILGKPPITPSP
ncbi:MAG: hypothetical protein ABIP06_11050 [Pyrinomonadaceae bacterium]